MAGFSDVGRQFGSVVCPDALAQGAHNLLVNCGGLYSGQHLLIVHEAPSLGWYDAEAPLAVASTARAMGAQVRLLGVGCPSLGTPAGLEEAVSASDVSVFFARLGDQSRFCPSRAAHVCVVSYARTATALASGFGTRDHGEMLALKDRLNRQLHDAREIVVSCPLGTILRGSPPDTGPEIEDVTIRRFPMSMPAPMLAAGFSGRVALSGWLTPTGSRMYDPACLALDDLVMADVSAGRIVGFDGSADLVRRIEDHYARVAERFGIDRDNVHSWHAGIHDGCDFIGRAADNPDLWSNTVFGSPKYLHFHTCGDYAPGEICWMISNPTVTADGVPLWENGALTEG